MLFQNLSAGGTKPGVLSVIPQRSDNYSPKSSSEEFPLPLGTLKDSKYMAMKYDDLLTKCKLVKIDITAKSADSIESYPRSEQFQLVVQVPSW